MINQLNKSKLENKNKRRLLLSILPLLSCTLEHPNKVLERNTNIDGSVRNQIQDSGSVEVDSQTPDVMVDTIQRDIVILETSAREASVILTNCGICTPYYRQLAQWNNVGSVVRIGNYDIERTNQPSRINITCSLNNNHIKTNCLPHFINAQNTCNFDDNGMQFTINSDSLRNGILYMYVEMRCE